MEKLLADGSAFVPSRFPFVGRLHRLCERRLAWRASWTLPASGLRDIARAFQIARHLVIFDLALN